MRERLQRLAAIGDPDAIEALARVEMRRGAVVRRRTEPAVVLLGRGCDHRPDRDPNQLYGDGDGHGDAYFEAYGDAHGDGYGDGAGYGDSFGSGRGTSGRSDGDGESRP